VGVLCWGFCVAYLGLGILVFWYFGLLFGFGVCYCCMWACFFVLVICVGFGFGFGFGFIMFVLFVGLG